MSKITYNGIIYKTEFQMCKALNINYCTYVYRKKQGYTLEERINGKK